MKKIEIETQSEWLKLIIDGVKGGSDYSNGELIIYKSNNLSYENGSYVDLGCHTKGLYILVEEVKLSDFLKENDCYDEFIEIFDREYAGIRDFQNNPVLRAFNWVRTKQGHTYWGKIHDKWKVIEYKTNDMLWLLDEPKTETITIEKWLVKFKKAYQVIESSDITVIISGTGYTLIKKLDTYEVEVEV
jgi:hypothetical protein